MILHRSVVFRCARQAHSTLPKTLKTILALPHVFYQYRNMNLFPFRSRRLTKDLRIDLLLAKDGLVVCLSRCVNCKAEHHWYRNINLFPFRQVQLRTALGSTNPWLTNIAKEPGPFQRTGFSPVFTATPTKIHIHTQSIGSHDPTSTQTRHPSTKSPFNTLKYR